MVAFGHTAVGSLVGLASYSYFGHSDPVLGLTLTIGGGIVSHYVMDFIPHGHIIVYKDLKRLAQWAAVFDFGLSFLIFLTVAYLSFGLSLKTIYILIGILASNAPDILDGFVYIDVLKAKGLLKIEHQFHELMHWHGLKEKTLIWGKRDIWQVSVIVISLICLVRS